MNRKIAPVGDKDETSTSRIYGLFAMFGTTTEIALLLDPLSCLRIYPVIQHPFKLVGSSHFIVIDILVDNEINGL